MRGRQVRHAPGPEAGAALLVLAAAVIQQLGAALAVTVFPALGGLGIVVVRFTIAATVLCAAVRPRVRGLTRAQWTTAAALAGALTSMSLLFYNASGRIPLGIAVTIEVCGPLVLSVAVGNARSRWLWALLAFAGVALLAVAAGELGRVDAAGYAFAAGAACGWAAYIVASARAAGSFPSVDALALATLIGAVVTTPFAAAVGNLPGTLDWPVLGTVTAVALTSSVVPHSLELMSLRRLPPAVFAILTSLSPVVATVIGWALLDQRLGAVHYVAIALVTIASAGAVRRPGRPRWLGRARPWRRSAPHGITRPPELVTRTATSQEPST
jgi:inner membrane transporter RhtA